VDSWEDEDEALPRGLGGKVGRVKGREGRNKGQPNRNVLAPQQEATYAQS